jgi:hypothetical protein
VNLKVLPFSNFLGPPIGSLKKAIFLIIRYSSFLLAWLGSVTSLLLGRKPNHILTVLTSTLKTEASCTSETLVFTYKMSHPTRRLSKLFCVSYFIKTYIFCRYSVALSLLWNSILHVKKIQPEIFMDKCILNTVWPVVLKPQEICELWTGTALPHPAFVKVFPPSAKLHIRSAANSHFAVCCHLFLCNWWADKEDSISVYKAKLFRVVKKKQCCVNVKLSL